MSDEIVAYRIDWEKLSGAQSREIKSLQSQLKESQDMAELMSKALESANERIKVLEDKNEGLFKKLTDLLVAIAPMVRDVEK